MIKHRIITLVTLLCAMIGINTAYAGQVDVTVSARQNPLPAQGALYMTDPGKYFSVILTNTTTDEFLPVRLEVRLEGPIEGGLDVWPTSGDSYLALMASRPMPMYIPLQPGQTRMLTQSDMYNMFQQYNGATETFAAGLLGDVFNSASAGNFGRLPEGHYGLKIVVKSNYTNYEDPGDELGEGTCFFDICYSASAPSFTEPYTNSTDEIIYTDFPYNNPRFKWTEPVMSNTKIKRQFVYDFKIMRVAKNQTPQEALASGGTVAFQQLGLMTPHCIVPYNIMMELKRSGAEQMVAQVTARSLVTDDSNAAFSVVSNDGKSEILVLNMKTEQGEGTDNELLTPEEIFSGEHPIVAKIVPKYTELPSYMEPYFKKPSDLFTVELENKSSEDMNVSLLLQYYKNNWGVTARTADQHTDQYITVAGYSKVTLSDEDFDKLAGNYEMSNVIAFKAKTGFVIGPPSVHYFESENDTVFMRVCRHTGGKPILREELVGYARSPFITSGYVVAGERFKIVIEPKYTIMPADPELYFVSPEKLFDITIKNLSSQNARIMPVLRYQIGENTFYAGKFRENERIQDSFIELSAGAEKKLTANEIKQFFGGYTEFCSYDKDMKAILEFDDYSVVEFDATENYASVILYDYEKIGQLALEDSPNSAKLQSLDIKFETSDMVFVGDVQIEINPRMTLPLPSEDKFYITQPGRLFEIKLTNLTDADMNLIPAISYEGREIDGFTYSYGSTKSYKKDASNSFNLPAGQTITLEAAYLTNACGDETFYRYCQDDSQYEFEYEKIDEIVSTTEPNHLRFELFYADQLPLHEPDDIDYEENVLAGRSMYEFYVSDDVFMSEVDLKITHLLTPMPYNVKAYFTKPEKLFEIELTNTTNQEKKVVLFPSYEFKEKDNNEEGVFYTCDGYEATIEQPIVLEAGQTKKLTSEEVHRYLSGKKIERNRLEGEDEIIDYILLDSEIKLDTEKFHNLTIQILDDDKLLQEESEDGDPVDCTIGNSMTTFQVSASTRLDDVSVTVKPLNDPIAASGDYFFKSPGSIFEVELKNNTANEYTVIPVMAYLFDVYGSYYIGINDTPGAEVSDSCFVLKPHETKKLTPKELNRSCGFFNKAKRFDSTPDGVETSVVENFENIVNLTSFNQVEVVVYSVDTLKALPKGTEYRNERAMLGGSQTDFNATDADNVKVVNVKLVPKNDATFDKEPEKYFEKPGDLFEVELQNLTAEKQDFHLRIMYNNKYYIHFEEDSIVSLAANQTLKLPADRLSKICGGDMYIKDVYEYDESTEEAKETDPFDIKWENGDNTVSAIVWRKKIEDETKPNEYTTNILARCDTVFTPMLMELTIGKYDLTLTEVTKINGTDKEQNDLKNPCFQGKGYVHTTIMGVPVRVACEFDTIYVDLDEAKVTKGLLNAIKEENTLLPYDLFKDEMAKLIEEGTEEEKAAKVDEILNKTDMGAFYQYGLQNMANLTKLEPNGTVKLPLGITFPMGDEDCPATIQLADMQFTEKKGTMDLLAEFVLPEAKCVKENILIFAARDLETDPDQFLPASGKIELVKDFTLQDPISDFQFTFKAPTESLAGCYVAWENGSFGGLGASFSLNIPTNVMMYDDGSGSPDPSVKPHIVGEATIQDAENWTAKISMESFQLVDLPGYTFYVAGGSSDGNGLVLDRSKKYTPAGIKFDPMYDYKLAGLSGRPEPDSKAYNEWQGFYMGKLGVKFPHFIEINENEGERMEIAIEYMLYDESGFSMSAQATNIIDVSMGGWGIALDKVYFNLLQTEAENSKWDCGLDGRFQIPLLHKVDSDEDAEIGFAAKIAAVEKSDKTAGLAVTFETKPIGGIGFDFMLADVNFSEKSTFKVIYCDTLPEEKQTLVELILDGELKFKSDESCDLDFELPCIPFSEMRFANYGKDEFGNKGSKAGKEVKSPDGGTNFSVGKFGFTDEESNEAREGGEDMDGDDESDFWGFPIVLNSVSIDFDTGGEGGPRLGVYINGGLSIMGGKKFGLQTTAGITIWSKIDFTNMDISYDDTEFKDLQVDGSFGGFVKVKGTLEVASTEEKSGFNANVVIDIKDLFQLDVSGGYFKMEKTEADLALDKGNDKNDKYYHAGYLLADVDFSGMGGIGGMVKLTGITGGFFINYAVDMAAVESAENFVEGLKSSVKPKYKTYGGAFGVKLAMADPHLLKGEGNILLVIDETETGMRCPGFMLQAEIHAICASADADEGLINAEAMITYEDTTTPDKGTDEVKRFKINITVDAEADCAEEIEKLTGVDITEVADAMGDLMAFDQENADAENQGDGKSGGGSSSKSESSGDLKAGFSAHIELEFEIRHYPNRSGNERDKWHLYVGQPDEEKRCRITFIDLKIGSILWAKVYANAYLCLGNELPNNGALPPVPAKVQEALGMKGPDGKVDQANQSKLEAARQSVKEGFPDASINGGIMFGAALGAEFGCEVVFCYCELEGMLGFDLVLKQFDENELCADGKRMGGKNGFYANGQIYAMFRGEIGLMIDLWIFKGKIPLVDITFGALLQGGFPNPSWAYGRVRAKGSVLGGLIKFSSTIEMSVGRICVPVSGNPLDDVKIFGDVKPGAETIEDGWAENALASCYGDATFTTNMQIGRVLPLVDERATMERAGMDGDGTQVIRSYKFMLHPTFQLDWYRDADTDQSGRINGREITYTNPSFDLENYVLQTGSLEPNTLYRVTLSGYALEKINEKWDYPMFNDKSTDYEDKQKEWTQTRYCYFRTGKLSENIYDEVKGRTPLNADYGATLYDATNPTIMLARDRSDYWSNPDYEFYGSVKELIQKDGKQVAVFPDFPNGMRKGEKTQFDNLEVVQNVERGYDSSNKEYEYVTVSLSKALPKEFFKTGSKYRYEIRRINRTMLDSYIQQIEENYKNIMSVVAPDADYETQMAELEALASEANSNAAKDDADADVLQGAQVINDMLNYYKEVEEKYGKNTAEQRMREYVDEIKNNSDNFAEIVYTHDYVYKGYDNFHVLLDDWVKSKEFAVYDTEKLPNGNTFPTLLQYRLDDIGYTGYSTRDNNPYYALNFWHSTACIWDSKTPAYKLNKYAIIDNQSGIEGVTWNPEHGEFRYNPGENGTTMNNAEFEKNFSPEYARLSTDPNKRWHKVKFNKTVTGGTSGVLGSDLPRYIHNILNDDAWEVHNFEQTIANWWASASHDAPYDGILETGAGFVNVLAEAVTSSENSTYVTSFENNYKVGDDNIKKAVGIRIPIWQLVAIYAADKAPEYGLNKENCGRGITNAYKYMSATVGSGGSSGYTLFTPSKFTNRVNSMKFTLQFVDGYNTKNGIYGVRPSTSSRRNVSFTWKSGSNSRADFNNGSNTVTHDYTLYISDPILEEYLTHRFDINNNGKLSLAEIEMIKELRLDFKSDSLTRQVNGKSQGVENFDVFINMKNLEKLTLINNPYSYYEPDIEPILDLQKCTKLKYLEIRGFYNLNNYYDYSYLPELETLIVDRRTKKGSTFDGWESINEEGECFAMGGSDRDKSIDFSANKNLKKLVFIGRNLTSVNIQGLTKLEYVDFRHNFLSRVDARYLYNINVAAFGQQINPDKMYVQKGRGASARNVINVQTCYVQVNDKEAIGSIGNFDLYNSPNYRVVLSQSYMTQESLENALDTALVAALKDIYAKRKSTDADYFYASDFMDWVTNVKSLNLSNRNISTIDKLYRYAPKIEVLDISYNNLKDLDLTGFQYLKNVNAYNNLIRYVDVIENSQITELNVENNDLAYLPMENLTKLEGLNCNSNNIEQLNVYLAPQLWGLRCSDNIIKSLDLSGNNQLTRLYIDNNFIHPDNIKWPAVKNLRILSADNAFTDEVSLDLSGYTRLSNVSLNDNPHLVSVILPQNSIEYIHISNCTNLLQIFKDGYIDMGGMTSLPKLKKIDVSGCLKLLIGLYYTTSVLPNLEEVNITSTSITQIQLVDYSTKLRRLKCGLPQRDEGKKVVITAWDTSWGRAWDNVWSKYEENQYTVRMVFYNSSTGETTPYDPSESVDVETITDKDKALREAMGELCYDHFKKLLAPDKRALHVDDINDFTEFDCTGLEVNSLPGVISFMPKLKKLVASDNQIGDLKLNTMSTSLKTFVMHNNYVLKNVVLSKYLGARRSYYIPNIDMSNCYLESTLLQDIMSDAMNAHLILNGDEGQPAITMNSGEINYLEMLSQRRELTIEACNIDTLVYSGKSLEFSKNNTDRIKLDKLILRNTDNGEPITLTFQSADMALLWVGKWAIDNPGVKFNLAVNTGDLSLSQYINNQLGLVNTMLNQGAADVLTDDMRRMVYNTIIDYAVQGSISRGAQYESVLSMLGLNDDTIEDSKKLREMMGTKFYKHMCELYAKDINYLMPSEIAHLTTLDCANMAVADLNGLLGYMPAVKVINAADNNLKTVKLTNIGKVQSLSLANNTALSTITLPRATTSSVDTLDLSGANVTTSVFSSVLSKVLCELKINGSAGDKTFTINSSLLYLPSKITMNSSDMILKLVNAKSTILKTIFFGGSDLHLKYLGCQNITTIKLTGTDVQNVHIYDAVTALRWIQTWSGQNNIVPSRGKKYCIKLISSNSTNTSVLTSRMAVLNTKLQAGNGMYSSNQKIFFDIITNAVSEGLLQKGDATAYDELYLSLKLKFNVQNVSTQTQVSTILRR